MTTVAKLIPLLLFAVSMLAAQASPFRSRERNVAPSPSVPSELILRPATRVVDYDIWPTEPDVPILLHDSSGSHVVTCHVGDVKAIPLLDLPVGFEAHAIAVHATGGRFFISGKSGQQWSILAADDVHGKAKKEIPA